MLIDLDQVFSWLYHTSQSASQGLTNLPVDWLLSVAIIWFSLTIILSIFIGIILVQTNQLRAKELAARRQALQLAAEQAKTGDQAKEWHNILQYLDSDNPSDWKLAIIEADTLLDRLVQKMGYPGDNLGERLKAVEPSDFKTLQAAWDAHKVRNIIAHSGDYQLTKREAKRVIGLYEEVFKEFHYI